MGRRLVMLLVMTGITVATAVVVARQASHPGATVTLWEYQTEVRRGPAQAEATRGSDGSRGGLSEMSDGALNALGREGWELTGLTRREIRAGDQMQTETVYVFRRPRGEGRR